MRAAGILLTIMAGMFIVVVVMNQDGFIDQAVRKDANDTAKSHLFLYPDQYPFTSPAERIQLIDELTNQIATERGINLPYWPRQFLWTWNMLTFNWGDVEGVQYTDTGRTVTFVVTNGNTPAALRHNTALILAQYFPNTLLVIGVAYALVFSLGLPLAIYLSRNYNNGLDRFMTALAPFSSIPSWVYGVVLVSIFAIQLRWLPAGGKFDLLPPETSSEYVSTVARHMVLPVTAIMLSMFFQVVYIWRTYFMLYTQEDYVELAIAQGLPTRTIDRNYILRPSLPYILTNFILSLTSFWQTTTALEYFFNWPGIGWMYLRSLLLDDLMVSLGMVVIFAYFLGGVVLLLDLAYLLLDPRIRFNLVSQANRPGKVISTRQKIHRNNIGPRLRWPRIDLREWWQGMAEGYKWTVRPVLAELRRYPSAMAGSALIAVFLIASVYAMIVYPYNELDSIWNPKFSSHVTRPRVASPIWVNWFRNHDLPQDQIFDSRIDTHLKKVTPNSSGGKNISITYVFDVPDGDFPQSAVLYFLPRYAEKAPFASVTWIAPDGREFHLKNRAATLGFIYDLAENIPNRYLDDRYQKVGYFGIQGGDPRHYALFATPISSTVKPLAGTYHLRLDTVTFEPNSDMDAELVILGQVYGWAGTDHLRRELSIGLLWGMPVALGIGMLGALTTSLFAMLIAASSAWIGGWVDGLSQRITEINMMLPILAIGVLLAKYFHVSIWVVLSIAILLNAFGGTTRAYRAAFLQVKESPYIEAARAYGASDFRIIVQYMIPRIFPVMVPQVVMLVPGYVFLEATLAIFGISTPYAPTWGRIIYDAIKQGALRGNYFWILEPIGLLLVTSLAFAMLGFTLDRVLNPRLRTV